MDERYVIHLVRGSGGWSGILEGENGSTAFDGLHTLLELLETDGDGERRMEQLRREAMTDPLTGMLNRRGVELEVRKLLLQETEERLALLFLDVDNLKRINDTWGHLYGDRILKQVADVISATVEDAAAVGRISGDEFVVLFRDAGGEARLREQAQRLCQAVEAVGPEVGLSISIGGTCGTQGACYERLLAQADRALYEVKRRGKNGVALYGEQEGLF